jgi:colanic acid/amylovoran biosynthesis protein
MTASPLSASVRKISIINAFASNGGDAAILFAIIKQVYEQFGKSVQIVIYDQQRELVSRYLPGWDFRSIFLLRIPEKGSKNWLRLLRLSLMFRLVVAAWALRFKWTWLGRLLLSKDEFRDLQDYANSDAIVTTGGTYLVETYPLLPKLFGLEIARILRKPLIFYTQSLGPFQKPLHRYLLKRIFNYSHLVLLRDSRSLSNVEELRVRKDHLVVSSDVVFSFAQKEELRKAAENSLPLKDGFLTVGLSVRDWPYFKTREPDKGMNFYLRSVAAMVTHLIEKHGARAIFISTCQGIPEYHEIDSNVALKIRSMLPPAIATAVDVDEKFHDHEELMDVYRTCDFVISTRMHGVIMALSSGTPVMPIAYEFKTTELFNRFGLAEWVLDIETIEPDAAVYLLKRYLIELPTFRRTLFEHVEQSRQEAVKSGSLMRKAVLEQLLRGEKLAVSRDSLSVRQ